MLTAAGLTGGGLVSLHLRRETWQTMASPPVVQRACNDEGCAVPPGHRPEEQPRKSSFGEAERGEVRGEAHHERARDVHTVTREDDQLSAEAVGDGPAQHRADEGAKRGKSHDEALDPRPGVELIADVEKRARDDAGVVSEEKPAQSTEECNLGVVASKLIRNKGSS